MSGTSAKLLLETKAERERQRRSNFENIIPACCKSKAAALDSESERERVDLI